jgi:hypothetical protein
VRIPLQGCHVSVVTDCLQGKSLWWQKGPLLIAHPQRTLLRGEAAFYLFTEHAPEKEQWLLALQEASSSGSSGWRSAHASNAESGRAGGTAHDQQHQQQHPQRQLHGLYTALCGQMRAALAARGQLQLPQAADLQHAAASNNWSCEPHLLLPQQNVAAAAGQGSVVRVDLVSIAHSSDDCVVGLSVSSSGTSTAAAAKAQSHAAQPHSHDGQMPHSTTDSVDVPADSSSGTCQQQQSQQFAASCGAPKHSAAAAAAESDTYGLNVLLSRVAFELLQSKEFEGRLGGALQQWLDGMRRPAYLDR